MEDFVDCVLLSVYCVENDPISVSEGEPRYYGFNFHVRRSEAYEMTKYIQELLKEYGIPCDGIEQFGSVELPVTQVSSKEGITKEILRDKDVLIEEARRHRK